jgi:hypothetical protein
VIFSTRFLAVHDLAPAIPATYIVPAGHLAVVRNMDAYFGASLSDRKVFARGSASEIFWEEVVSAPGDGWRQWQGRHVFFEGEAFSMFVDAVGDISASGYLLTP